MSKITIKDVAKRCKVSVSTVSRAINNHPEINSTTRSFILAAVHEMGYIPNSNARNLKRLETNTIAVIIKGIDNLFFQPMFRIIEHEITTNGYSFLLYKVEEKDDEIEVAIQLVNDEKPKGIIFLGGAFTGVSKHVLKQIEIPFVVISMINRGTNPKNCAYIGIDDRLESKKLLNFLISKGHKKIALIGSRIDDKSVGRLRIQGYKDALAEAGIPLQDQIILMANSDQEPYTFEYGYAMADKLFNSKHEFSAIYCISDTVAIGLLKRMHELGLDAPDNYAVVGFDGLKINEYLPKSITTIKQPAHEMAHRACKELFNIINHERQNEIIILDAQLYIGQTT